MHIENVRIGFATNSSSYHSIVFGFDGGVDELERLLEGGDIYLLKEKKSKDYFLAAILYEQLSDQVGTQIAASVVSDWCKVNPNRLNPDIRVPFGLPSERTNINGVRTPSRDFFDDFRRFIRRSDVSILGHYNGPHVEGLNEEDLHDIPIDKDVGKDYICRKDGDWWAIMNRFSGTKMRISFKDTPRPAKYETSKYPELVDIKITDFCPFGCSYCYQDSTVDGRHADYEFLRALIHSLADQDVFEIAFGGGETTMHPRFKDLLKLCDSLGIVANFTTRSLQWLNDRELVDLINRTCGRFAYSIEDSMDMYKIYTKLEDAGVQMRTDDYSDAGLGYGPANLPGLSRRVSFQVVMGTMHNLKFIKILQAAADLDCDLTLLGYKETGRGSRYKPRDYDWWIDTLLKTKHMGHRGRIGVDTTMVQQYEKEMEKAGISHILRTKHEGAFSMYIDAVKIRTGASSYVEEDEYIPLDESKFSMKEESWSGNIFSNYHIGRLSAQIKEHYDKYRRQVCKTAKS